MDLRQLRYLQCIVDSRSFTRAAAVLNVAQSALTLHVQKLELELGTQLLFRHARGIEPTPAGEILMRKAKQIIEEVEKTKNIFLSAAKASDNTITLGILPMAAVGLTASIVQRLADEFPVASINTLEAVGPTVIEAVLDGHVEAGLVHHIDALPDSIVSEVLHQEEFLFVRSRTSASGGGRRMALEEAIRHPLILPPIPHPLRTLIDRTASQMEIALSIPVELQSLAGRIELVERNYGCSFMPASVVADKITSGALVGYNVYDPGLTRKTSLVYARRESYRALEQRAQAILRQVYCDWTNGQATS